MHRFHLELFHHLNFATTFNLGCLRNGLHLDWMHATFIIESWSLIMILEETRYVFVGVLHHKRYSAETSLGWIFCFCGEDYDAAMVLLVMMTKIVLMMMLMMLAAMEHFVQELVTLDFLCSNLTYSTWAILIGVIGLSPFRAIVTTRMTFYMFRWWDLNLDLHLPLLLGSGTTHPLNVAVPMAAREPR